MTSKDPIERLRKWSKNSWDLSSEQQECIAEIVADLEARYMKLPVDADGVPIRPGDDVEYNGHVERVNAVGGSGFTSAPMVASEMCRHAKPDTVEGIIMEAMQHAFSAPYHVWTLDMGDKVAEYAERIRKAV